MKYEIKESGVAVLITLHDRTFETLGEAMRELIDRHGSKKIFFMQSIEKENEPLQVLIVLEF